MAPPNGHARIGVFEQATVLLEIDRDAGRIG
jgi:hypothetical protein